MTNTHRPAKPRSGFTRMKTAQAARKSGETKAERQKRFAPKAKEPAAATSVPYHVHGLHAVRAALANPNRTVHALLATPNARQRLDAEIAPAIDSQTVRPQELDALLGEGTVHQGIAALVEPLAPRPLEAPYPRLSIVLDQVTDPHNVGAILRSAAAFDADAVISTARHGAGETATLAKAASGALELVPMIAVRNLAEALETLKDSGTLVVGLDSDAPVALPDALTEAYAGDRTNDARPIALVMGSEGKGLRMKTRETCNIVAKLPVSGAALASLNVSNAAVLALYIARQSLPASGEATS